MLEVTYILQIFLKNLSRTDQKKEVDYVHKNKAQNTRNTNENTQI